MQIIKRYPKEYMQRKKNKINLKENQIKHYNIGTNVSPRTLDSKR